VGARRSESLSRMPRHLRPGERLVIASQNPGKVEEIETLLMPYGVVAVSAGALGLPEPEETGASFEDNAALKARAAAEASGLPALADDSGLVVPALDGAPGIYSARWAGPAKDFRVAMQRVQLELGDKSRQAHFVAVLALAWPPNQHGGGIATFRGEVHGQLTWPPRGERGFGYDPIFVPDGYEMTFGEMAPEDKHHISHRARAFAKLVETCFEKGPLRPEGRRGRGPVAQQRGG
jgi:XTP/dITP diphosphohydrolase